MEYSPKRALIIIINFLYTILLNQFDPSQITQRGRMPSSLLPCNRMAVVSGTNVVVVAVVVALEVSSSIHTSRL